MGDVLLVSIVILGLLLVGQPTDVVGRFLRIQARYTGCPVSVGLKEKSRSMNLDSNMWENMLDEITFLLVNTQPTPKIKLLSLCVFSFSSMEHKRNYLALGLGID